MRGKASAQLLPRCDQFSTYSSVFFYGNRDEHCAFGSLHIIYLLAQDSANSQLVKYDGNMLSAGKQV